MVWDYRVMKRAFQNFDGTTEDEYGIYEVYWDDQIGVGWTKDPVAVTGESPETLRQTLLDMLGALDKGIMDYGTEPTQR